VDQFSSHRNEICFSTRVDLDITDFPAVRSKICQFKPELIINAVAFTDVDKAESNQKIAYLVNYHAVGNIAMLCSEFNCALLHISTDYVFDGTAIRPYVETDATNPKGVYGNSKLLGEKAIQESGCRYIIIRTSWVFSEYGKNFLRTMLRLGSTNHHLNIVGDQIGCPTYAQDIARFILKASGYLRQPEFESEIVHFCGDEPSSWYQFALAIFTAASDIGLSTPRSLKSISSDEYPTPASRPAYSVMDCQKANYTFEVTPSDWRSSIPHVLIKLS
jgi:dTDP-4-dehydrorhamnose reductase